MSQKRFAPGLLARQVGSSVAESAVPAMLLVAFALTQFSSVWRIPFINEDYAFLDVTRGLSFLSLWSDPALFAGPWFRPWSQGFHYWLFQYLLGSRLPLWHAVSLGLMVVTLTSYYALVRRIAGDQVAGISAACAASLVAWGLLATWIAGVQDLWMLFFSISCLHAVLSGRRGWAIVTLAGALLSKETAAVLPLLAAVWLLLVERRSARAAWRLTWPMWAVLLAWAVIHPFIGGRWLGAHSPVTIESGGGISTAEAVQRAASAVVNLDIRPHPEAGWAGASVLGLFGFLPLACLIAWSWRRVPERRGAGGPDDASSQGSPAPHYSRTRVALFGVSWAFLGWIPLLHPSLNWHSYYTLFGSLGAWLALGLSLARSAKLGMALALALLLLRAGRSTTVVHDWGEESYVRRAGRVLEELRTDLQVKVPSPKQHTRFYFHRVPSEVGFLVGDGPSLRVWYDNPTLTGGFWRDFRRRDADSAPGADRFFRRDSLAGWVEVFCGAEDIPASRLRNPAWFEDHVRLARAVSLGEDWPMAQAEYSKLSEARPDEPSFPYLAGLAALALEDSITARKWIRRAAEVPTADAEIRQMARAIGALSPPPRSR